ncbi:limonene-1,2-epoxide hydrolase family protein [Pantoea sp. 18069]|uniref:limonene-1,2-epoxide hydrolase family protein n=1 Tax=Pantoea sp. 18069 TaxID=2681415 RepID=UPI00135729EA|nr:limonene-1,2-epoxide hydrolase family protein [Pantoea sp. 18069]
MGSTEISNEMKIRIFLDMKEAWESKNWRACANLMAEQGVLHSVMLEPCVGRENFYERIRKTERPHKNVKLHILKIGVVNGTLFVEREDEIILHDQSRKIPTVGVIEFSGDKISHWKEYYDRATMINAIQEPAHH